MNKTDDINDYILGAFVDGELNAEDSESIINEMDNNKDIRERIYKLRRAKDLMQLGFDNALPPSKIHKKENSSIWKRYAMTAAASITAVAILIGSGVFGYFFGQQELLLTNNIESTAIKQNPDRILLHINESNKEHFAAALTYTENFLESHKDKDGQIAVVANAGGLDLMRSGVSPFKEQISRITENYKNVYFIACANSVRDLHNKGVKFTLIDNVKVEKPALDHIIDYVQKGWTYKKVKTLIKV